MPDESDKKSFDDRSTIFYSFLPCFLSFPRRQKLRRARILFPARQRDNTQGPSDEVESTILLSIRSHIFFSMQRTAKRVIDPSAIRHGIDVSFWKFSLSLSPSLSLSLSVSPPSFHNGREGEFSEANPREIKKNDGLCT